MSLGNQKASFHSVVLGGLAGSCLGIMGALSGKRREKSQDCLYSILLVPVSLESESGPE